MLKQNWQWIRNWRISPEESDKLLEIFSRSTKIALELEYNLSRTFASCEGDQDIPKKNAESQSLPVTPPACPCSNKDRFSCKDRCSVSQICSTIPNRSKCERNIDKTCLYSEYQQCPKDCSRWKFSCIGSSCTDFQAPCNFGCIYFSKECSTCRLWEGGHTVPSNVRKTAIQLFKPSGAIEDFGETGVEKITIDPSLLGDNGIEICTVGRRMNIRGMWELNNKIMQYCLDRGGYVNNRCSIHMHLLLSHFPQIDVKQKEYICVSNEASHKPYHAIKEYTEAETEIPSIVLGNFIQLVRRFTPALVWLSATGTSLETFTRWSKYRQPFVHISPLEKGIDGFIKECVSTFTFNKKKPQDKGKYGFINFNHIVFSELSDGMHTPLFLKRFHLESRFMDGNLSPTVVTAFMVLHYALLMKAIRLSRYGLLEAFPSIEEQAKIQKLTNFILNNNPEGWGDGDRDSCTDTLFGTGSDFLVKDECKILLNFLKSELSNSLGMDRVLWELVDYPVAMRLIDGHSWEKIELELKDKTQLDVSISPVIDELIDTTGTIVSAPTIESWADIILEEVAPDLKISKEELLKELNLLITGKKITWHEPSGSFIRP